MIGKMNTFKESENVNLKVDMVDKVKLLVLQMFDVQIFVGKMFMAQAYRISK